MEANFTPTQSEYKELGAFRFWCQKVLPMVYDDSLSYYEVLGKLVNYLNSVIENTNAMGKDVTSLYEAYELLQGYVNNYFNSLDVQDEINNKLDQMAEDNSLSALIAPFIPGFVEEWLNQNVTPTTPVVDASLSIGGAAADAKATGDMFITTPKVKSITGGSLAEQVGNTISRISNFSTSNLVDLPDTLKSSTKYGWVVTYGTVNKMQIIYSTTDYPYYQRFYHASTGSWTDWSTNITVNTPTIESYTGGTLMANQPVNTIARISSIKSLGITDAPQDRIDSDVYCWLATYGSANKFQVLYFSSGFTIYQRFYHASTETWTSWATTDYEHVAKVVSYTGGTLMANQPANTIARISSIKNAGITDAPPDRIGSDVYCWLATYGGLNKMQILHFSSGTLMYLRYYHASQTRWTEWAGIKSGIYTDDSDGLTPTYVAFGASTTVGAVHHFDGTSITYSKYNYPNYVGEVLGLNTVNLGKGTTGFMARGSDGTTPNIMDSIYNNNSVLKNAKLVSIVFGYGNDSSAGLPIGEYDDYYPYDEDGYHPTGATGITEMLNKGATLMGCLNWCIKYLNEKYPRAQVVIIFGAPSSNDERSVRLVDNTDNAQNGVAPYKLNFTNPYTESASTNSARGIWKIGQELPKLRDALRIPIFDMFFDDGNLFSWYQTYAKDDNGEYSIFSTKGDKNTPSSWVWNSHPNDDGYLMYARYIAGIIIKQFKH